MRILAIEPDPATGKALQKGILRAGHEVAWSDGRGQGLQLTRSQQYDLILVDPFVLDTSVQEILRSIRQHDIRTGIMILSATDSVAHRVLGLKQGADDYLAKPFLFPELLARIEAIGRRLAWQTADNLTVGGLSLDLAKRRVEFDGAGMALTPTEFSLLELLMRHVGQVVTRKLLSQSLWNENWEGITNVIEVHVNRLRGKLRQAGAQTPLIHTVRGRGYVLRCAATGTNGT